MGSSVKTPLILPQNFDSDWNMPFVETEIGRFHITREAAQLARRLAENGTDQDLEMAQAILHRLLRCQETRADHPHRGNFPWMAEDGEIEDLNAVEFILRSLIPMMTEYGIRLKVYNAELHDKVMDAIELGVEEIIRLDVHLGYTNIALLDILNTTLGGELLGRPELVNRGRVRLYQWSEYTLHNGHVLEFNSPTYTPVTLDALSQLSEATTHRDIRAVASGMANRIALAAALRFHTASGRWAGPHGRGYVDTLTVEPHRRELHLQDALAKGTMHLLTDLLPAPDRVWELGEWASQERGLGLTTYLSRSFTLGTAHQQLMSQSNVLISYIAEPKEPRTTRNVVFSRFLTNDQWFGDYYHQTDRSRSRNLIEEGLFVGSQRGNLSLAGYAPSQLEQVSQAALVIVIAQAKHVDELVIGASPVDALPVEFSDSDTVGFRSGDTYGAVRCIERDELTSGMKCTLRKRGDALVIEYPMYKGPRKSFWQMRKEGGFFKGYPAVLVALTLGEVEDAPSTVDFAARLAELPTTSDRDAPAPFDGTNTRPWTITIGDVAMEIDQYRWRRIFKKTGHSGSIKPIRPLFQSAGRAQECYAVEATGYPVAVGNVTANFARGHVWLICAPDGDQWLCGWVQSQGKTDTLTVTCGEQEFIIPATSAGLLLVRGDQVFGSYDAERFLQLPDNYRWSGMIGDFWQWN